MSPEEIEDLEIRLVLEAIYSKSGRDFRQYGQGSMRRCVRLALTNAGFAHFGELQHGLLTDSEVFSKVLSELTIQVSEMFRDPQFYKTFRERVIPVLRTYPELKIWHAGCSSGEEVYTTAIILAEEGLSERTRIYATDTNEEALRRAREGRYSEARIANFERSYWAAGGRRRFEDYYSRVADGVSMSEELRRNLVFFQHDLGMDQTLGEMHVIMCRNVLIYFGPALQERVVSMFWSSLRRGGFLCLGSSEGLPAVHSHRFTEISVSDRVFRRGAD